MQDTASIRSRQMAGGSTARSEGQPAAADNQKKVQLAAEFIVERVQREASALETALMQELQRPSRQHRADMI